MKKFWIINLSIFIPLAIMLSSCLTDSQSLEPDMASGVYINFGYEFYRWEGGPALMIWHDAIELTDCGSKTYRQSYEMECRTVSKDHQSFDWQYTTVDGNSVEFSINDQPYHLVDGNLFLITSWGGETVVRQLQRDLSGVQPRSEGVIDFGLSDPAILELMQIPADIENCVSSSTIPEGRKVLAEIESARGALVDFFAHLHAGEYAQAAALYGGEYDLLWEHNPGIDPIDRAALFQNACTVNGAQCLEVRRSKLIERPSPAEFRFVVQFSNDDGSPLPICPCCGGAGEESNQTDFIYNVRLVCTGDYLVMELPVYMP
jgi:hypothetical protein